MNFKKFKKEVLFFFEFLLSFTQLFIRFTKVIDDNQEKNKTFSKIR